MACPWHVACAQDELARARQTLPMHEVEDYVFDAESGPVKMSDLFGDKDQLILVHFMFDPAWEKGCSSCSLWADGYSGIQAHITRKAGFAVVGKAPQAKLAEFAKWKGWTFPFISSNGNTFNRDMGVEFTPEEIAAKHTRFNYGRAFPASQAPGYSVFFKDAEGKVYHTYSTYARGMETMGAVWGFFDLLPRGRDEKTSMDWLKHKEEYDA